MKDLALLGVFAHPDDEQLMSGSFAKAAREGIRTGLICATRGEEGEISDPALSTQEELGRVREAELRAAVTVVGVKYLWFLDYRDSGMMGTPANDNVCFYRCEPEEATGKIVKIIREFQPTAIVTFEPGGGYGHPDHITISRLTTEAFDAAADPNAFPKEGSPWQASRLFYSAFPRSFGYRLRDYIRSTGMDVNPAFAEMDLDQVGLPDNEITNLIDVSEWQDLKVRSVQMHRTQMNPDSPFNRLPRELEQEFRSKEYFVLAKGVPIPEGEENRGDLFAGLRS